ncbi:hypothetical protein EMGBS15_15120 [Filimonas sp.]|nr:hypothetical protein EMGBS15_15120 [Filimonas sp.]
MPKGKINIRSCWKKHLLCREWRQVGDTGIISMGSTQLTVTDTKKENDLIIHFVDEVIGDLKGEVIAKLIRQAGERYNGIIRRLTFYKLHCNKY